MTDFARSNSRILCTPPVDFTKPLDTSSLKDQSVLVTGGAHGLGAAFVKELAEAGAYVTFLDVNVEQGQKVANELNNKGLHTQFVKADVTSWDEQTEGFKTALSFAPSGAIDIVICNAGIAGGDLQRWLQTTPPPSESSEDPKPPRTAVLDVNLTGTYYTAHLALHYFRQPGGNAKSKQIIFVSSLAGYMAPKHGGDYGASKFGVRGLWRGLRDAPWILGDEGAVPRVRANLLAPSFIKTNMTTHLEDALSKMGVDMAEPADVANAMLRMVSDESVVGRAVAVAPRKKEVGDGNFDIGDDFDGFDGGKNLWHELEHGVLNSLLKLRSIG